MSLWKLYATDKQVEQEGIWVPVGKTDDGQDIEFRLARAGGANMKYLKVLEVKTKSLRRAIDNEMVDKKTSDAVLMDVFAETVVLDWKNVVWPGEKEPLKCTKENILRIFKALPDLFDDVRNQATKSAHYRQLEQEKDQGNS